MDELVKTFHIDWTLMLAQLVNFAIVLGVLYKFAYGPILKTLNDRSKKIEKGLRDADESQKKLAELTQKEKEVLNDARKEAQATIAGAEKLAVKNKEEMAAEAKVQAEKIVVEAKRKIEEEKNKMISEVKKEVADLVVSATEKLIGEKLDKKKDEELINKTLQ